MNKQVKSTPINVVPIMQFGEVKSYLTSMSISELYAFKDKIEYNPDAQRGLDENNKPLIDRKHVTNIRNAFLNKQCIRGHLTWSIKQGDFKYKDSVLYISNEAKITMPDSAHRHFAFFEAFEMSDDKDILNSNFPIEIVVLDSEEEKEYFSTINGKSKSVCRNRFLYLSNDIDCKLLREAIDKSEFSGKVEFTKIRAGDKLVKFSTLYDAFISTGDYKITEENYNENLEWLSKFFTGLYKSRKEFSTENKAEIKVQSMLLEEITWWGYSQLSKTLINDSNWKRTLKNRMNKNVILEGGKKVDFFSKSLYLWHGSIIKGNYNPITDVTDYGSSVINSNPTRMKLRNLFINNIL